MQYLKPEPTFHGLHTQQMLLLCGQASAVLFLLVVWRLTRMQVHEHERQQAMPTASTRLWPTRLLSS